MKRDPDLERTLLLTIEAHDDGAAFVDFSGLSGHSAEEVGYHVGLLGDAGLAVVVDTRTDDAPFDWSADRLTRAGHEYLDTIRDPAVWQRAKERARSLGDFSVETLSELAKAIIREKIRKLTGGSRQSGSMSSAFSPSVIEALVQVISGGPGLNNPEPPIGIYRSKPDIDSFLMSCRIDPRHGSGSRLPALREGLFWAMKQPEGNDLIRRAIETVADPRSLRRESGKSETVRAYLNDHLGPDGFEVAILNGKAVLRRVGAGGAVVAAIADKTAMLNFDTVLREIDRAIDNAERDPEDAVTAACSTLEAVCRSILVELGQPLPPNPAASVRGPKHVVRRGRTPVLAREDARRLLAAIDISTMVGLRDRALIALLLYTFARIGAAVAMQVRDVTPNGRRWWVRLREKGGRHHELPAHHNLEAWLLEYIEATGIGSEPLSPLFRSAAGRSGRLTDRPLLARNALDLVRRRARDAGIRGTVCCHSCRATGITAYLEAGGTLETAQSIAGHASPRTTRLYDRRDDAVTLDEIERIIL